MPSAANDHEVISAALALVPSISAVEAAALTDDLIEVHTEPQRRYHTITHVREVLKAIDDLSQPEPAPIPVRLAALYHDAVYDPLAHDNEERSAELARNRLTEAGLDAATTTRVAALIRLTAGHDVGDDDPNGELLIDADLAILTAPPERYDEYRAQIREEYADIEDESYLAGRTRVLEDFMSRATLFHTPVRRQEREASARWNMSRELAALGRPL